MTSKNTSHPSHDGRREHQALGPGHEFDTIRMLMARWGDLAVDIGDDAAVLPSVGDRQRVVSTDTCVEDMHFRRAWITPFEIGVRAATAALSDLAAMGAQADSVLFALVVPDDWRESLGDVADGLATVVRASGARIVGGNLSRGQALSITTTVIGSAAHAVPRRGAKVGDVLVLTGVLGGPGAAIRAWDAGLAPSAWARERFAAPAPRLAEGASLAAHGARAMLDISDGLAADARHLAAASGVRLSIDASRIPIGEGVSATDALKSGEEYELLAVFEPAAANALIAHWSTQQSIPLTVIGTVSALEAGGAIDIGGLSTNKGASSLPQLVEFIRGHDHFSE